MDQRELDELKAAGNNHPEMETLLRKHRTLDDKVAELSERPFLSPDQHLELSRLAHLMTDPPVEHVHAVGIAERGRFVLHVVGDVRIEHVARESQSAEGEIEASRRRPGCRPTRKRYSSSSCFLRMSLASGSPADAGLNGE